MATPPLRCPNRIKVAKAIETGTIGSRPIVCPGWACLNVEDLLSRVYRLQSYLAPGFAGRTARKVVRDELSGTLRIFFDGTRTWDDVDQSADVYAGLEVNRLDFITNVAEPPASPSTRTLTLTLADGTVQTAAMQVGEFRWAYTGIPGIGRATLDFVLPDGRTA